MSNWDKLDLHLENLMPGLAMLSVFAIGWSEIPKDISDNWNRYSGVAGIALVGAAYMVGVIANIIGRLIFDNPSENLMRPFMFKKFTKKKLPEVEDMSPEQIHDKYNDYITDAIKSQEEIVINELSKRRQTGRLLRSAFLPILLAIVVIYKNMAEDWHFGPILFVALIAVIYAGMLALYAYSEVTVFHEAYLGHRLLQERSSKSHED